MAERYTWRCDGCGTGNSTGSKESARAQGDRHAPEHDWHYRYTIKHER